MSSKTISQSLTDAKATVIAAMVHIKKQQTLIASLETIRESEETQMQGLTARFAKMERERDELRTGVSLLSKHLWQYGTHQLGCNWHEANNPADCDCEWERVREEVGRKQ